MTSFATDLMSVHHDLEVVGELVADVIVEKCNNFGVRRVVKAHEVQLLNYLTNILACGC
ncbi:MAG: hypothetical protein O6945_16235 [Gammaproteobacteria bacterium]|nr:hypothetical protein [Gammaproteobacteria bacterium]